MRIGQLAGHFRLQARHQGGLEFTLQVGADLLAEGLQAAILDAEQFGELAVDLWQLGLLHLDDVEIDLGVLAGQLLIAEIRGELDRGLELVTGNVPGQGFVQRREQGARTQHAAGALLAFGRETVVVRRGGIFEHHEIASSRGTRDLLETAPLQAEGFQHAVDVGVRDLRRGAMHFQRGNVDLGKLGHDLEGRRVGDLAVLGTTGGVDRGIRDRLQLLLFHRLAQRAADQVGEHFAPHLLAEALLDDRHRYLARPESLQANGAPHLRDPRADLRLEPLRGKLHRELALQRTDILNRNLHDVSWYCSLVL